MTTSSSDPSLRRKLEVVPTSLVEAFRAATIDQDVERLHELVDGVAEHDRDVAEYLRGLIEDIAYEALADFFDVRGR